MKHRMCAILAIVAVLSGSAMAGNASAAINNDDCLSKPGQAGLEACARLADAIGPDLHRLNANARVLEESGRHESAVRLYTAAAAYFPDNRRALQGLVRSRANARASRIIADISPSAAEVSACWTERWMRALEACRIEVDQSPNNARLLERLGDVARSVGDVGAAQAAYAQSLAAQPDNANLHRKRNALTSLLAGSKTPGKVAINVASTTDSPAAEPAVEPLAKSPLDSAPRPPARPTLETAVASTDTPDDDAIVQRLELLETLKRRNLITASEYQERRNRLLAAAFVETSVARSVPRYRGLHNGRFLAVVIGNNQYEEFPDLETAAADANAIADVLRQHYGFEVTTLIDADRYGILTALSALRREATEEDSILVYYAGHGLLDEGANRGFWLPVDAERENFAQWISTTDIAGLFAGAEAKHALVVADSCFAGALLRAADATGVETLRRLAEKRSRTVLTSGGLEPVVDSGDGLHSVFAGALLDALGSNRDVLEAGKLFAAVRDRVVQYADQTPQYAPMPAARHDGGDFLFIPKTFTENPGTY